MRKNLFAKPMAVYDTDKMLKEHQEKMFVVNAKKNAITKTVINQSNVEALEMTLRDAVVTLATDTKFAPFTEVNFDDPKSVTRRKDQITIFKGTLNFIKTLDELIKQVKEDNIKGTETFEAEVEEAEEITDVVLLEARKLFTSK